MRKIGSLAVLLLVVSACDGGPTSAREAPGWRGNGAANGGVIASIPDTLTADANGRCDLPLATTSTVTGEFGNAVVTLYHGITADTIPVNYSQMADVIWPIPVGNASGVLYDSEFADHQGAPYTGTWALQWTVGANTYYGTLSFSCVL